MMNSDGAWLPAARSKSASAGLLVLLLLACATGTSQAQTSGHAPADQAAFDRLVSGKQVGADANNRLVFLSPGRLREYDVGTPYDGDYGYVNTGSNTGTLTYTYDVTGNDPNAEKTVIEMTFTSATTGTFVSTYTERGSAPEVLRGPFALVDAQTDDPPGPDHAPADQAAFNTRFVGKTVTTVDSSVQFLAGDRLSETDSEGTYSGSYEYQRSEANKGTLLVDYDDGDRCVSQLVFTSATTGTYAFRCDDGSSGSSSFQVTETAPPAAGECAPGDRIEKGEKCQYPGTSEELYQFRVDSSGRARIGFAVVGGTIDWEATNVNGVTLNLRAVPQSDGSWILERVAGVSAPSKPTLTLLLTPASISESGGTSTVTATLSEAAPEAFTLTISAVPVSPALAGDITLSANLSLDFALGATTSSGTVTIAATDNDVVAASKAVTVSGAVSTNEVRAPADVTLTITDDDVAGPGHAPADQAAFNALVVGKRAAGVDGVTTIFESGNRFREGPYAGRYTYRRTGSDTGTLRFDYDDGDWCEFSITFASAATGRYTYDCSDGETGSFGFEVRDESDSIALWGTIVTFGQRSDGTYGWSRTSGEYPGSGISTDSLYLDGSEYDLLEISYVPNQSFECILEDGFPSDVEDLVLSFNPDLPFKDATRTGSTFTWLTDTTPAPGEPVALTLHRTDTTPPPSLSGADVNGDGTLDADDALVMYYAYALESLLGNGDTGGVERFRRTLLSGRAGQPNPGDTELKRMLLSANEWKNAGASTGGDVNGDGTLDADDALVMYYAYALESLLGNGDTGGVERFRRTLLSGRAGRPNPSDEDLKQMLRNANALRSSIR